MPIFPISFSIPESKIIGNTPAKTRQFAHIIPGDLSTYIHTDEESYRRGYQESVYGRTKKKGGWDCLRHYEILANGCVPWFEDLENCPPETMTHFPKDLVAAAMKSETPEQFIPDLLEYTRTHLTCRAMAQYVFNTVGCPNPKRVLFLSGDVYPDYLRCLTLIGMKQILGSNCVDLVEVPHIYEDYPTPRALYGKGFTYTCILPTSTKSPPIHIDEIRNHSFDLIVYGSLHRGTPFWDIVTSVYKPSEIVLLCGEDCDLLASKNVCPSLYLGDSGYMLFVREL